MDRKRREKTVKHHDRHRGFRNRIRCEKLLNIRDQLNLLIHLLRRKLIASLCKHPAYPPVERTAIERFRIEILAKQIDRIVMPDGIEIIELFEQFEIARYAAAILRRTRARSPEAPHRFILRPDFRHRFQDYLMRPIITEVIEIQTPVARLTDEVRQKKQPLIQLIRLRLVTVKIDISFPVSRHKLMQMPILPPHQHLKHQVKHPQFKIPRHPKPTPYTRLGAQERHPNLKNNHDTLPFIFL